MPQADYSRNNNGPVRREPVETEHPVVRVHPVTREKALFVNQGFTQKIVGYKKEESDYLLNFLYDHIAKGADFRIRGNYHPGTVVVWVRSLISSQVVLQLIIQLSTLNRTTVLLSIPPPQTMTQLRLDDMPSVLLPRLRFPFQLLIDEVKGVL